MNNVLIIFLLIFSFPALSAKVPKFSQQELLPGGNATTKRLSTRTYIMPGQHLRIKEQMPFWKGLSFFRDPWVIAPASTTDRDGLGPLFNSRSCITCHQSGGRGPEAQPGISKPTALLIRLLGNKNNDHQVDPVYGGQIQPRGIDVHSKQVPNGVAGEASVSLSYQIVEGKFASGEVYQLRKPNYQLVDLNYGPLNDNINISARYAPNIYGMGLLDAINEADIVSLAKKQARLNDGISGKVNWALDVETGQLRVGRFGFRASHPNLIQQVAAAFTHDIGITNRLFNAESCTSHQTNCLTASEFSITADGKPEIADNLFDFVVQFNRHLGVPPARNLTSKQAQQGRDIFYQANCHVCHQPSFVTNKSSGKLSNQTIWPYTDLLLHDMGEGLADQGNKSSSNGREWRTPPLWGIGMQRKILGTERYLHDGRATSLMEAILWHGGEAQTSKEKVLTLSPVQREALIRFLQSI